MKTTVVGVDIDAIHYAASIQCILEHAQAGNSRYACIANVHMVMEAHDSAEFRRVVNEADLTVPDGMPLVWMLRAKGHRDQTRVYGPTLMLHVLESAAQAGLSVGFYGGGSAMLDALVSRMQSRFDGLNVVYFYSPPYRDLSPEEDDEIVHLINRSGVRILFVGLGCPKQERWMGAHRGTVNAVMIGVGAAFDFHAGMKPQAPIFMQRIGMEWVFRLFTEPRRLWKRYLYHNPRFIFLAAADLLGILKD